MDSLGTPAPKKMPMGLIIGGVVVVVIIVIVVVLWQMGVFDNTQQPSSATPSPDTPQPQPQSQPQSQSQPQPQPRSPVSSPHHAPSPVVPSVSSPNVSTAPVPPAPSTSCPPGYAPNDPSAPGYNIAVNARLDTNYCYQTLSRPTLQSYWPSCPSNATQFQIDAFNENCYVPKVQ